MTRMRWLISGAGGQLGGHVLRFLHLTFSDNAILATSRTDSAFKDGTQTAKVDLADHHRLAEVIGAFAPTHILHLGGVTAVGEAFRDPQLATHVNTDATRVIAESTERIGARMLFTSTDMVYSGENAPYDEDDDPQPLSHYGKTKAEAERAIRDMPNVLIARLPLMYGFPAVARETTFAKQVAAMHAGEPLNLFTDEYRTPIALADAARAVVELAANDLTGIIHVAGPERLSRYDMGVRFASALGIDNAQFVKASRLSIDATEPRAADLSLSGDRFNAMFPDIAPRPITATSIGTAAD